MRRGGLKTLSVRGVAQPGSASVLGTEGREFESLRPDHFNKTHRIHDLSIRQVLVLCPSRPAPP